MQYALGYNAIQGTWWTNPLSAVDLDFESPFNTYLYGGYDPFVVTITHILNEKASIGWTSYSHTGVPVPIFAQGDGADEFSGFYDNTDIAKKLATVMGVGSLPQVK